MPHAYGDHSSCGNWCGYLKNPASYKHRGSYRQKLEAVPGKDHRSKYSVYDVHVQYGGTAWSSQIPNSPHFSRGTHLQKKVLVLMIVF